MSIENSNSCPFCTLPRERIVHENTHAFAIRDGYPVSPGHTLIISRRHVQSFFDTTAEEKQDLLALLEQVHQQLNDPSVANATSPLLDRGDLVSPSYEIGGVARSAGGVNFNIGINDGPAAGQTVPHLHIHLIPRYAGDVQDPRGGVRWVVPEKADYWSVKR